MSGLAELCMCGHDESVHTGDGVTESACKGTVVGDLGTGGCGCVGFTVEPRCDFCSVIPAPWTFPTHQTAMRMEVQGGIEDGALVGPAIVSHESWAACEDCAALVLADDREGVAQRLPMLLFSEHRDEIIEGVRQMQKIQFWDARSGAGYRH